MIFLLLWFLSYGATNAPQMYTCNTVICCRTSIAAATHSSTDSCRKTSAADSERRYGFILQAGSPTFVCALAAVIAIKGAISRSYNDVMNHLQLFALKMIGGRWGISLLITFSLTHLRLIDLL